MNDFDWKKLREQFLKYAPPYAQRDARLAIEKVFELHRQGALHSGLYYIVLVDLVDSSKFAVANGNAASSDRIEFFVKSSFESLVGIASQNAGLFVKEIGDAVLYVFQHFPGVLKWRAAFARLLNRSAAARFQPIQVRTCVHIGEVYLDGVNPLSLAVSQTFKMEKSVPAGAVALTAPAYSVAWPTLSRGDRPFERFTEIELDGFHEPVPLYSLGVLKPDELDRLASEKVD